MSVVNLREDLLRAAKEAEVMVDMLDEASSRDFVASFANKYSDRILLYPINTCGGRCIQVSDREEHRSVLERLLARISARSSGTMYLIAEGETVLSVQNADSVLAIIDEMYGFEYFITDPEQSFVLCENTHDMLCGLGWVEGVIQSVEDELYG
jgi:hypothetical protein